MGFKDRIRAAIAKRKKASAETRGFARIIATREKTASRQAFEKEAIKQAKLRGERMAREKANRPSFGQKLAGLAGAVAKSSVKSKAPVKRRKRRTVKKVVRRRRRR